MNLFFPLCHALTPDSSAPPRDISGSRRYYRTIILSGRIRAAAQCVHVTCAAARNVRGILAAAPVINQSAAVRQHIAYLYLAAKRAAQFFDMLRLCAVRNTRNTFVAAPDRSQPLTHAALRNVHGFLAAAPDNNPPIRMRRRGTAPKHLAKARDANQCQTMPVLKRSAAIWGAPHTCRHCVGIILRRHISRHKAALRAWPHCMHIAAALHSPCRHDTRLPAAAPVVAHPQIPSLHNIRYILRFIRRLPSHQYPRAHADINARPKLYFFGVTACPRPHFRLKI